MTASTPAERRQKILFAIGSLGGGGSERRLLELIRRLDRSRFEPQLWLAYRRGDLLPEVPADVPVRAAIEGEREARLSARIAGKLRLISEWRGWALSRSLAVEPVDLVFSWSLRMAYETALAARAHPVARIAYCVAEPSIEYRDDFLPATPWKRRLARWSYASAERVYVNSTGNLGAMTRFYDLPPGKVELFGNLRDFATLDRQAEAAAPSWPADGARLLTVGRLHHLKGQAHLLEAVAQLVSRQVPVSLLIVGQGPEEASLRALAERLGIAARVGFCGFQPNTAPYYRHADLFVLPSLTEGLPNVLLEALALGTPALSADCPTGPREMLEDGRWGTLVPPGDVSALVEAIERTLRALPAARARAQEAMPAVRARYDIATGMRPFEDRLLAVIDEFRQRTRSR